MTNTETKVAAVADAIERQLRGEYEGTAEAAAVAATDDDAAITPTEALELLRSVKSDAAAEAKAAAVADAIERQLQGEES